MFVADRLIYLQLHKTGSTHIAHLLAHCIAGTQVGTHQRLTDLETEKYLVGSIRNPWSWYVSLWAFGCMAKGDLYHRTTRRDLRVLMRARQVLRQLAPARKEYGSLLDRLVDARKSTPLWHRSYADNSDASIFRDWLSLVFDPRRSADLGAYGESSLHRWAGLLTYRYLRLYSRDVAAVSAPHRFRSAAEIADFDAESNMLDGMIRSESLEDDLIAVLDAAGYSVTEKQKQTILDGRKSGQNPSSHEPTEYYYDPETVQLVAEREAFIIKKHNYFPPSVG